MRPRRWAEDPAAALSLKGIATKVKRAAVPQAAVLLVAEHQAVAEHRHSRICFAR